MTSLTLSKEIAEVRELARQAGELALQRIEAMQTEIAWLNAENALLRAKLQKAHRGRHRQVPFDPITHTDIEEPCK